MDAKIAVYNAARDGKLHKLKACVEHKTSAEMIAELISAKTSGATPLIAACRNGHLNIVEYITVKVPDQIEAAGSVTFDGETIEGAPPLWCAAAAGHLPVVQYLTRVGANVNKTTFTNSTPLRAACFDGHCDIVEYLVEHYADIEIANSHGHTCLMIACYKGHKKIVKFLLEKEADVNRKSLKGNTALHDCAESGSLEIMQLLLDGGAIMEKDSYGMTPLLAAAVTGHTEVVEYLTARPQCSRQERVDALELLGATYVDRKRDMLGAANFWRIALHERYSDELEHLPKPAELCAIAAYDRAVEARSEAALQDALADPDAMRMQALLVRERILGPAHPDTSYYIRYRGAVYADLGNFDRCILLWSYALDMQQQILEPLSPMTQSSLLSFAELFSFMMSPSPTRPASVVHAQDMLAILNKSVREMQSGGQTDKGSSPHLHRLMLISLHLIQLVTRVSDAMSADLAFTLRETCYRLVRQAPRGQHQQTLLHLACHKDTSSVGRYPVCSFPSLDVVVLLLEVGADVHAIDDDGGTPLHTAAANKQCPVEIFRALLDAGAHYDRRNAAGKQAHELMKTAYVYDVVCPLNYTSLQCLAAQKIKQYRLRVNGHLTHKLEQFVDVH